MKKKRVLIFNCQIHCCNSLKIFALHYIKDACFVCHKIVKHIRQRDCIHVKGKFVYQPKAMHATISQVRLFLTTCIQFIFKMYIYSSYVLSTFFLNVTANIQLLLLYIIPYIKYTFLHAEEYKLHAFGGFQRIDTTIYLHFLSHVQ